VVTVDDRCAGFLAGTGREIGYARAVARRLPVTFAALAAGRVDPVHVKIIEDVTRVLSDADAAAAVAARIMRY